MNLFTFSVLTAFQMKEVEHKAIEEGIRENGIEDGDKIIRAVLAKRHAQVGFLREEGVGGSLLSAHDWHEDQCLCHVHWSSNSAIAVIL